MLDFLIHQFVYVGVFDDTLPNNFPQFKKKTIFFEFKLN